MIFTLKDEYTKRAENFSAVARKINTRINTIALIRLFVFILFAAIFILFFKNNTSLSFLSLLIFSVVFLNLVKYTQKLKAQVTHYRNLSLLNRKETKALEYAFEEFDGGKEFLDGQHPYSGDMDIFGEGSLFQSLNRTVTLQGKARLASWLQEPLLDKAGLLARQESIAELKEKLDWRQHFQATSLQKPEQTADISLIRSWLDKPVLFLNNPFYRSIARVLPALTFLLIGLAVVQVVHGGFAWLAILAQLVLTVVNLKAVNQKHLQISNRHSSFQRYAELLKTIEDEEFKTPLLRRLRQQLLADGHTPSQAVKNLSRIAYNFDSRLNMYAALVLNGLLLWDINNVLQLEKWQQKYLGRFLDWIDVVGDFDAFASLGGFAHNKPHYVFPEVNGQDFVLEAVRLGHPLIREEELVRNDYHTGGFGKVDIITGANMAGKSTFLRSIGINLVLALAGAPVFAGRFTFYPIRLFTSLRTNDSLQKNESFFYAELKRLKRIIDLYEDGKQVFVLLDETLKGTNSKDQHMGSEELIKKLIRLKAVGLVATHDTELAELKNIYPQNVDNYCFEIEINGEQLNCSYTIRPGICSTMNASILMKQMNITT